MSPIQNLLAQLSRIAKEKETGPVACCWCNNQTNFIKHGSYKRYSFSGDGLEKIQRYLCRHDKCRRTFSILPHPFLRITRFSICMFTAILDMFLNGESINEISREFGIGWGTAKRYLQKGRVIIKWMSREAQTDPVWKPTPCISHAEKWSIFIRMFSIKFYPERYSNLPPTECEYC